MKGMTTCKVCGRDFPLMAEEHYVAQDPQKVGAIMNLINTDKAIEYDAFDCPHCGCQNIMQVRKSPFGCCDCEEPVDSSSEVDHEGCLGCKYECKMEDEEPCRSCKHCYSDKFEREEDEEDE